MSRDRDPQLEQALKHQLRAAGTPDRDSCVDPETLAAWADGGLDAAQMSAVELHVSSCARCQAIAAVAARSAPVVAPAVNEGWFRFPRWAIAPLAAAAALVIWMVVPQDTMQAPPAPAPASIDANKEQETAGRDASIAPQAKEIPPPTATAPAEPVPELRRERAADSPQKFEDRQQRVDERGAALGAAAARAPAAPVAPVAPAAPAAPAVADAMLQKSARLTTAPVVIVSPDPASRWRIVNGAIERSEDSGASWVPIRAPGGEVVTAGASPARSVCWLIGPNGLVMVTADGMAFARVPLPERIDLTGVSATDARNATVTTSDGRRFSTNDSGRSWKQN